MNQDTSVENKSNKGLYIAIGVVVLLVVGWFLKGSIVGTVPGIDGDVDRNLDGSTTYTTQEGEVTVGSNKLPDNWPSDAPKYPNATIQYSGSSNPQTGEQGAAVAFTTSDNLQKVVDFYQKELSSNGWKIEQTANVGGNSVISATKDNRTFGVYIADAGQGQVSVTIGIGIPK